MSASKRGTRLAALLYRRRFSVASLERALLTAWAPIWNVSMTTLEENLFLFRFEHQVDLNKVLRDGPWRFNQFLLVMSEVAEDSLLDVNKALGKRSLGPLRQGRKWIEGSTQPVPVKFSRTRLLRVIRDICSSQFLVSIPRGRRLDKALLRA